MGLLQGKRILVTGVARPDSIALAIVAAAAAQGAEVVVAAFPRDVEAAAAALATLPVPCAGPIPVDVTIPDDLAALKDAIGSSGGPLDGCVHAVAFAPADALGSIGGASAASVELAFRTSTYSYAGLAGLLAELAPASGGSLVGLDFDSSRAWPVYNWMGPCKAALRSLSQYLARDLGPQGIRSNLVAAGPLWTRAAGGIPGFDSLLRSWEERSPLPWDARDPAPVADAVAFLLSDLARAITGEVLNVDGGAHAIAAGA